MCGICGILPAAPWPADAVPLLARQRRALQAMNARLAHRGPDDAGELITPHGALAMRRLAIIDLATGHQPLSNEDGTVWLVFNGELYNYRSLRQELAAAGHTFRTQSDTEVLVHAYEAWGPALLERLNGMFALALLDTRTGTALLARDRTGIKPLHYYVDSSEGLVFASELTALLAHPATPRTLDPAALAQYLVYEYVPTPRSILPGVQKLPPGHALLWRQGRSLLWQYWDLDLSRSERHSRRPPSPAAAAEELRRRLDAAVEMEMVADVPVGVLLSGGLDSSAVAASMVRCRGRGGVQSFSVAFDDPTFDESRYAHTAAAALGTQHHELPLRPADLLAIVPRLPALLDEPLADSSFVPTHLLARFARQHVTVALGGDGGDELFAGYSTLQAHALARALDWLPLPLRRDLLPALAGALPTSMDNISLDFKLKRFAAGLALPLSARHHVWLGSFRPDEVAALLGDATFAADAAADPLAVAAATAARGRARHPLNQALALDMKMYLEGDILPKVDRASMACGLEVRVPLLNRLLLDFAETLPLDQKLHGPRLTRKHVLRRAMAGRLPAEIISRPKKGFNMPVAKWLRGPLRPLLTDLLAPSALRASGSPFEPQAVEPLLDAHLQGRRDHRKQLWTLLVLELWRQGVLRDA
jgi:asparagine synthase (glutamine-hydrolysing)